MSRPILLGAWLLVAASAFGDLSVGLMPAENSIPLIAAERDGLFDAAGVKVLLVPFSGQLERETALQTGKIDGTVSDLVNAIQGLSHGSGARVASVTEGGFSLLSAPRSGIATLAQWGSPPGRRVLTGLLENSLVSYLTERMLSAAGIDPATIELVPIVQVPARLEMLLAGKIDAACLPEPLATLAERRGARRLAASEGLGSTPGVLLFTARALGSKRGEIEAFYRAYDGAVRSLARNPEAYRDAIVAGCAFPPEVRDLMRIPSFGPARLPSAEEVADVASWMRRKGLIDSLPAYGDLVARGLLASDARAP